MTARPNIGLQRTAPCGLAAGLPRRSLVRRRELGSFGAGIGRGGRIQSCGAWKNSRRSSPGSRRGNWLNFGRGLRNTMLSSGTDRSRRTRRRVSSTGSHPRRSRIIAGAKPATFEAFRLGALLALPGRASRTGSAPRPRECRASEDQPSTSLSSPQEGRVILVGSGGPFTPCARIGNG